MDKIIYGADTETYKGLPMTLQFYSEDINCDDIFFVNKNTATRDFLRWCSSRKRNCAHVVYVHYLAFDLVEFLFSAYEKLVGIGGSFEFRHGDWRISGCYGSPTFAVVSDGKGRTITIVDSYSFFRGSLDNASKLFCPDLRKLRRPVGIGEKLFTAKDTKFVEYAMRDAVIAYHIGKAIERIHQEFDIRQAVSVADMAATIFRHKFLTYTIPQPSREIIDAALLSYHGGKNNVTVERGWYTNVSSIDISSAYNKSMHVLPAFSNEDLYKRVVYKKIPKLVNPWGVYRISGRVADCEWPCVFSHAFKPLHGKVTDIWIQGMELNESLESGELKLESIKGYGYDADRDNQAPGLRTFVETFYKLKETAQDPVLRYMYKTIGNSVYGKFIQTRKRGSHAYTDIDAEVTVNASDLVAGGMFHPFIASAITAHTRARIHRLEHKYSALHTATDGIFTQRSIKLASHRRDADLLPTKNTQLGDLTVEATDSTLLLIRNKCYVLYVDKPGKKTIPSHTFKGKHIRKEARHGFQGTVTDLERMASTGERSYVVNRPRRLREAVKSGLTPNEFIKRRMTLKVGAIEVQK